MSCFKAEEIYDAVLFNYKGKTITFERLWQEIVEDVAYTAKDLSEALHELESTGKVKVTRVTSKRCSYKDKDIINIL